MEEKNPAEWTFTAKQLQYLNDTTRELMVEGSAGSGKTIFACSKVIFYALQFPKARIGVFRQTLPALKETAWKEIRELLQTHEIEHHENKSDGFILFPNGSQIKFSSLDDFRKQRSLNLDYVYIEQAEEIDFASFVEIKLRVRNQVSMENYGQILLVVQPETKDHWLYDYFYKQDLDETKHIHFHYTDNDFLPEKTRKSYDDLKKLDHDLWMKYAGGEWGRISHTIYDNWDSKVRSSYKFFTGGIDFGFNAPSVFLLCAWFDDECYIIDEVYKAGLTTGDFIAEVRSCLARNGMGSGDLDKIYADSANPDDIEEFYRAGYDVVGGVRNNEAKISSVKQTRIHIAPNCLNTLKEIKDYKWQTDRNGNILDKPVVYNDHAMDALGYAVYGVRGALSPYRPNDRYIGEDEIKFY